MSIDVNTPKQIIAQVVQEMTVEDSAATPPAAELVVAAPVSSGTTTITATAIGKLTLTETGPAGRDSDPKEAAVVVFPVFSTLIRETIIDLSHATVLREIAASTEGEGLKHRFVKVCRTADVGLITHQTVKLSGSGIDIGIQSHDTIVTHQKDLPPLNNVELFSQSPLIDLETLRTIGKNVTKYAKGESP